MRNNYENLSIILLYWIWHRKIKHINFIYTFSF